MRTTLPGAWRIRADGDRNASHGPEPDRGIGWPRTYDLLMRLLTRGREQRYREELIDLAGVGSGQFVLDVGCGTGTQAIAMHRRVQSGGFVTGVDVSESMLAVARRKAGRAAAEIEFRWADATQLPYDDGSFDVVTITTVLHMISPGRRRLCLGEAARVLKPDGRLLLIDYAGEVRERAHWSARHGRHGLFDLGSLKPGLSDEGLTEIDGGPFRWFGLHYLRGRRRREA